MVVTEMTPVDAIHAALDERGFYTPSCQEAAEVAAEAVPNGWLRWNGHWLRVRGPRDVPSVLTSPGLGSKG